MKALANAPAMYGSSGHIDGVGIAIVEERCA